MAVGDLVTADWECEYNGLAFGGDSAFAITQISGLVDLPAVTSGDSSRLLRHGTHPGSDFLVDRTVTISLELYGATDSEIETSVQSLLAAFVPGADEQALVMQIPGVANGTTFLLWCRPRRRNVPINREWFYRIPIVTLEVAATDPRLYALTEGSQTILLPSASGGMEFNEVPNITFGTTGTGGEQTLNNAGTFSTAPVFKLTGPVTDPRLINVTSDETFHWEGTVPTGSYLSVDMENRTVLLNGTSSRYNGLTSLSTFWELAPGDNSIQYRAAAYTASTAVASWRSAWV
jgi:hypothetical protein